MPVVASDLKFYGCANHAENDSSTQGGAIDTAKKVELVVLAADDTIDVVSSSASDTTQTIVITGRNAAGTIITENYALAGTTPDTGATTFDRILKVVMSGTAVGTVTVRRSAGGGATTLCTLEPGITSVHTLFYDLQADAGSSKTAYEKFFIKNTNGSSSHTGGSGRGISLTVEPANVNDCLLAVEDAVNDNNSATNRLTAPTGQSTFRQLSVVEPLPGDTNLDAGEAIGVWIQIVLDAGETPTLDDLQVKISGGTT